MKSFGLMIRPWRAVALLGVLALLASSCNWTAFRYGSTRTGFNPAEFVLDVNSVPRLHEVWTGTTGAAIASSPAVDILNFDAVYVGSDDGKLYAFDATNGGVLWTGTTGGPVRSSPTIVGGVAFVGSDDGNLYAFDAAGVTSCSGVPKTCAPLWTTATGGPISASPTVEGGIVYVGSEDGKLYAVDKSTGVVAWTAAAACVGAGSGVCAMGTPAVLSVGGEFGRRDVYVGSDEGEGLEESGKLYAFDASGDPLWVAESGVVQSSPAVANGRVFVSGATIDAVGPESATTTLRAFDASSGTLLLAGTVGSGRAYGSPAVGPISGRPLGVVSVASGGGAGAAFDAAGVDCGVGGPTACAPLRITSDATPAVASSAIANGLLYAATADATLDVYDGNDPVNCPAPPDVCSPLVSIAIGAPSRSSPAVSTGWVYVGTDDGKLHAFAA